MCARPSLICECDLTTGVLISRRPFSRPTTFFSKLADEHWQSLERVMHYLVDTVSYGIHFVGYDSNWISNSGDIKTKSGYMFTFEGGVVSLKFCKQTILMRLTTKAELMALDIAIDEASGFVNL